MRKFDGCDLKVVAVISLEGGINKPARNRFFKPRRPMQASKFSVQSSVNPDISVMEFKVCFIITNFVTNSLC